MLSQVLLQVSTLTAGALNVVPVQQTDGGWANHLTSAAMVVYGLQSLKGMPWFQKLVTAMPITPQNVYRVIAAVGAFLTAAGIHITTSGTADAGLGIALQLPPLIVLAHSVWDAAVQFAIQQVGHDLVVQKAGAPHGPNGPVA